MRWRAPQQAGREASPVRAACGVLLVMALEVDAHRWRGVASVMHPLIEMWRLSFQPVASHQPSLASP